MTRHPLGFVRRLIRRALRIPSPSRAMLGLEPDATWARDATLKEERRTRRGLRLTDDGWRYVDLWSNDDDDEYNA